MPTFFWFAYFAFSTFCMLLMFAYCWHFAYFVCLLVRPKHVLKTMLASNLQRCMLAVTNFSGQGAGTASQKGLILWEFRILHHLTVFRYNNLPDHPRPIFLWALYTQDCWICLHFVECLHSSAAILEKCPCFAENCCASVCPTAGKTNVAQSPAQGFLTPAPYVG